MVKAVLFDMDGLMFDTERLAIDAWNYAGKLMGYNITEEIVKKTCGLDIENTKHIFLDCLGQKFDFYACREIRVKYAMKYIAEKGLPIKLGLIDLLSFLKTNNYRTSIVTSTERDKVEYYMNSVNILQYFDELVTGDMVERGKPEPDIYLKAIEAVCVKPNECIALEDSPIGIESAYKAGAKPVMIPDLLEPDEQTNKMLYAILPSLLDVISLLNNQLE